MRLLCPVQQADKIEGKAENGVSSVPLFCNLPVSRQLFYDVQVLTSWCSTIDASKVPPSQFQKRRGSMYAVPGSRDGHVDNHKTRDQAFHAKLKEKVCFLFSFVVYDG